MKKYRLALTISIVVLLFALSMGSWSVVQGSGDNDGSIELLNSMPSAVYSFNPAAENGVAAANGQDPTVCFVPQDLSTNATVLILINNNSTAAQGQLEMYRIDGLDIGGWSLTLQPGVMNRYCSDPVNSTEAYWSWAELLDFGTYDCGYVKLTLPPGVIYDGYVVWNNGQEYNPGVPAPILPLQFISE